MNWCKKIQNLNDIPKSKYIGYLWQSDKEAPIFIQEIDSKKYETDGVPNNPFIQEAYLFDKEKNISVSIKHSTGKYLIFQYKLDEIEAAEFETNIFLAHNKLPGNLLFNEIWIPEKDENCAGLEVLCKKAVVFVGFDKGVK
jgi:CRISPR type III-associated protein (TIGR04423 family)